MDTSFSELPSDPKLALLTVFVAGLLSLLTPSVLPMLPITLATLGVNKASSWLMSVFTSACYVVGIVLSFSAFGALFALTGTAFGAMLGHPVAAVAIATLFAVMALNCFDIVPFRLPERIAQRAAQVGGRGPIGAFAAGLVAGVISSPCIGPMLAAVLTFVTTTRSVGYGALLLSTYGLGFGLPFLLIGTVALKVPKDGPLAQAANGVFGITLLVGAFWFLRGAFPALRFDANLPSALITTGGAVLVYVVLTAIEYGRTVFRAIIALLAAVGGCVALSAALADTRLPWCNETAENRCIAGATAAHDRTLLLFGGEWSTASHEMQAAAFSDPRVTRRLAGYGTVLVDAERNRELTAKYVTAGLPAVVVIDREGKAVGEFNATKSADQVLAWLDELDRQP